MDRLLLKFFLIILNGIVPKVGHHKKRIISNDILKSQDHFMVRKIPKYIKTNYTVLCVCFAFYCSLCEACFLFSLRKVGRRNVGSIFHPGDTRGCIDPVSKYFPLSSRKEKKKTKKTQTFDLVTS